jgi:uncharacterized delta-60 repeat protein
MADGLSTTNYKWGLASTKELIVKRRNLLPALPLALIAILGGPALAAGGDLDSTFGGEGKVTTNFTRKGDYATGVAIQADGKIVAAGAAAGRRLDSDKFAVARYNADGTLDATFGGDGKVRTNFTSEQDYASGVAVQGDGKIVAAGSAGRRYNRSGKFALARYHADGTLDATFGRDGRVTANFTSRDDYAYEVAIQADGKIVVAGTARQLASGVPEDTQFALARFGSNGRLDSTFGGDGKVTTDFEEGWGEAWGLAIQADGKIVVGGYEGYEDTGMLVRYNADGTLDTTFGGDGGVETSILTEVALQADGKIVATGYGSVLRYNADGTPDMTFGGDGAVTADFATRALTIQPDGKIVVAGGSGDGFGIARYNSDGTGDSTFGSNGTVITNFAGDVDLASGVVIQADGKIVAAGRAGGRFALARYLVE